MPTLVPKRPRSCTHIKVAGQRCGSPALRGEFFCYFHTRVIKGVQQRVDMQLHSMALLEDSESIQLSLMHVVDGLLKGTLDPTRARLIIQALRIAARNAKNVRFEARYEDQKQSMVREVPDYARQYLIEHPEFGPPIDSKQSKKCGAGAPAREVDEQVPCGADIPVREPRNHARRTRSANRAGLHPDRIREKNRNPSSEAAKERSPRRQPWDNDTKQPSSAGAKEIPTRIAAGKKRTRASASRHRRSRARQLSASVRAFEDRPDLIGAFAPAMGRPPGCCRPIRRQQHNAWEVRGKP